EVHVAVGELLQLQQSTTERRLAASGLADQAIGLATPDLQVDTVDGVDVADRAVDEHALLDREVHLEVTDVKEDLALVDGVDPDLGLAGGHSTRLLGGGAHRDSSCGWYASRSTSVVASSGSTVSGLWHRGSRSGRPIAVSGTSAGVTSRQTGISEEHLGAKAQPLVHGMLSATDPGTGVSRRPRSSCRRGIDASRPPVSGWRGWAKRSWRWARWTMRPAYSTFTSSHRPATTPRSWVIMISAVLEPCTRSLSRVRIWAWIVTSSAVVGSSAISSRGSQASAMAIRARCRMPPDSWWAYSFSRRSGSGMPTLSSMTRACSMASDLFASLGRMITSATWMPRGTTGFSDDSGSWKIIARSRPRRSRSSSPDMVSSCSPANVALPSTLLPRAGS